KRACSPSATIWPRLGKLQLVGFTDNRWRIGWPKRNVQLPDVLYGVVIEEVEGMGEAVWRFVEEYIGHKGIIIDPRATASGKLCFAHWQVEIDFAVAPVLYAEIDLV